VLGLGEGGQQPAKGTGPMPVQFDRRGKLDVMRPGCLWLCGCGSHLGFLLAVPLALVFTVVLFASPNKRNRTCSLSR
jgi:hypothetical protein